MIICETNDDIETYRWLSDSENPESREYVALHQVLPTYTSFSKPSAAVEESGNILVAFYKKSANEENYRLFYNYYDNASEEWTYGSSPVTGVDIVNPIEIINGTDFDHTHPIGIVSHNTDSWVSAIYIGLTSPMIYTKHLSNGSGAASSHNITTYWDMEYFHTSINDIGDLAIFWKNGSGECGYTTYINGMWTDYGPFTGALNECHEPQGGITNTNDIIVAWKDTFTGDNTITGCTLNNGTCEEEPNTIVNNSSDYISPPIGTIDTIGNLSLFWIIESSPGIYTPQTIRLAVGKDPGNIIDLTSTDNFYRYSPITVGVDRYGRIFSLFSLQDALGDTSIEWTLFD